MKKPFILSTLICAFAMVAWVGCGKDPAKPAPAVPAAPPLTCQQTLVKKEYSRQEAKALCADGQTTECMNYVMGKERGNAERASFACREGVTSSCLAPLMNNNIDSDRASQTCRRQMYEERERRARDEQERRRRERRDHRDR